MYRNLNIVRERNYTRDAWRSYHTPGAHIALGDLPPPKHMVLWEPFAITMPRRRSRAVSDVKITPVSSEVLRLSVPKRPDNLAGKTITEISLVRHFPEVGLVD